MALAGDCHYNDVLLSQFLRKIIRANNGDFYFKILQRKKKKMIFELEHQNFWDKESEILSFYFYCCWA